ncbi:MAG: macro domain-containing protein, partial [Brockia lithotrophica]|nr:macro domain-containing protein [Brockia lithotrophica]
SKIEYIQAGLDDLARVIRERGIRSIAVPALGAGLGGLDWCVVRPVILRALSGVEADVWVYEPVLKSRLKRRKK